MKYITNTLAAVFALGLIAAAHPASAKTYLTAEELDRDPKGHFLSLDDGTQVKIHRIKPPQGAEKSCKVHLPSLQKLAQKQHDKHQIGTAPIGIQLQARFSKHGMAICLGAGSGCMIFVSVPIG